MPMSYVLSGGFVFSNCVCLCRIFGPTPMNSNRGTGIVANIGRQFENLKPFRAPKETQCPPKRIFRVV